MILIISLVVSLMINSFGGAAGLYTTNDDNGNAGDKDNGNANATKSKRFSQLYMGKTAAAAAANPQIVRHIMLANSAYVFYTPFFMCLYTL